MTKKVLIVEDEEMHSQWEGNEVRDLADKIGEGIDVASVDSLEDIHTLVYGNFCFDCAVVDIMIFEKSQANRGRGETPYFSHGFAALDELLKKLEKSSILVFTQFPIPEVSKELLTRDLESRLLVKPAHFEEFADRVVQMLK